MNDFVKFGRTYEVIISGQAASSELHPEDVLALSVRNENGDMVPFGSFATVDRTIGAPSVKRYSMNTTASLTGIVAPHVSSSDGIKAMEDIVRKPQDASFSYAWTGEALQETQSGTTISTTLIFRNYNHNIGTRRTIRILDRPCSRCNHNTYSHSRNCARLHVPLARA